MFDLRHAGAARLGPRRAEIAGKLEYRNSNSYSGWLGWCRAIDPGAPPPHNRPARHFSCSGAVAHVAAATTTRRCPLSRPEDANRANAAIHEAVDRIESELQSVIQYLNAEVVPTVRDHSSHALRIAAQKLGQLADYMDEQQRRS